MKAMRNEMILAITAFFLIFSARVSCESENNATSLETNEEVVPISADDSEQELSQLQQVELRANGWTQWSEWSACSRSCDGGVAHQLRRCRGALCRGEHIRYQICNMQPCSEGSEFREDQCAAFNNVAYEGSFLLWTAHYTDDDPCALICKGRPTGSEESLDEDAVLVVAKLAEKVQDGTRCRSGSLDMCIDGKCRRVGCDLRIGSDRQIDECGVCGGDGSSCSRPLYHWALKSVSLCSVTCGGGYKMSQLICQNRVSGAEVEEQLCNASQKPDSTYSPCNTHHCPPKWHAGEWGPCSASCGGGSRLRQVHCVEEVNNTKIKVDEAKCKGHKPRFQESCNQLDCPAWHTSSWSGCSVSCGEGLQVRMVDCRNAEDLPSLLCTSQTKPTITKPCSTGIQCPKYEDEDELLPGLYHTQPLVQPYPPLPQVAHAEKLTANAPNHQDSMVVPSESTFIPEEWGPCSATCGRGVKKRGVHCKIFLDFSRTIAKLPDDQCSGPKPVEEAFCFIEPCSSERFEIRDDPFEKDDTLVKDDSLRIDDTLRKDDTRGKDGSRKDDQLKLDPNVKVGSGSPATTYSWKEQGYTHCSASCLGGVQELIVQCIRDDTQKVTSPYMCPKELKPEILIRTCNDHSCPPRWNYSEFSTCSQSCGIGIQRREVNCIHEVIQGGGNPVIVPNNMCPQPQPPERQYCNVLDCPISWSLGEWEKCSKTCGGGEKTRKVECIQIMAQNHTTDRAAALCPSPRPADKKPCNTKSCVLESDKPHIDVSNSTYIQHDPKKKKVTLKIGGAATVFMGTMIKIKCPVKRFNRTKIQWAKDHNYLPKTKKYKMSKKGVLRVQNLVYSDSGIYTCVAGRSSADLALSVKPKPGEFPTSEEIQKQTGYKNEQRIELEIADYRSSKDEMNPLFTDDQSHERHPDAKPTQKTKIMKSTYPPAKFDGNMNVNSLNAWLPQSTTLVSDQEQTFSNSRGHRMVTLVENQRRGEEVTETSPESSTEPDEYGSIVVLGKGSPENLKFEWVVTEWSKCSPSCGGNGIQMRAAQCMVRLHNTTQDVEGNLCEDAGLETPVAVRKCGLEECPKWVTSEWAACGQSKCFTWNTAIQRREVTCQIAENTTVNATNCNENEKPPHRQECYNENCKGKWKVGPWSECAAACDMQGVKYRILQCVWYGTKKPAGTACKDQPRPPVMKSCKGPPCSALRWECKDHSVFCPNVKAMNLCRVVRYQQQCCQTCTSD